MEGLLLASLACLTGICSLPEVSTRFETAGRPAVALLAMANIPRASLSSGSQTAATPLAERPAPSVTRSEGVGPATGDGDKLSRTAITNVVQQKTGAIKRCYERALVEDGTYGGTVEIGWKIQTDGRVATATVIDAQKRNTTAEDCLVAEILTWQFPAASEPTAVGVYPFVLDAHLLAHHTARSAGAPTR